MKILFLVLLTFSLPSVAAINSINSKFPSKPSLVPNKLLGVKKENWKTFGLDCQLLHNNITTSKKMGSDRWGVMGGRIQGKENWRRCLIDIQRVKKQLSIFRVSIKEVKTLAAEISKIEGKKFPLNSLLLGIANHINNIESLDTSTLYAIDVFNYRYAVLQRLKDGQALFVDQGGELPSIFLFTAKGTIIKAKAPISNYADYYSFKKITEYTNTTGFKRQAFVFVGHKSNNGFREKYINAAKAYQWISGKVNTKGM